MRRFVASHLERGSLRGAFSSVLEAAWRERARTSRAMAIPFGLRTIGVCGATLGGSGVTPVVLELARELSRRGERIAVVGHGYRAAASTPRLVAEADRVESVGDEALWLARSLAPAVPIIVGGTRSARLRLARRHASCAIIDATLQASPRRLDASVLVVDAEAPWGAGHCPPRGDLRASAARLLEGASCVCAVGDIELDVPPPALCDRPVPVVRAFGSLTAYRAPGGVLHPVERLRQSSFGLIVGVARPGRIVRSLAARGLMPKVVVTLEDHAAARDFHRHRRISGASSIDLWLTTAKCRTKLGDRLDDVPICELEYRLSLPEGLIGLLQAAIARDPSLSACSIPQERLPVVA